LADSRKGGVEGLRAIMIDGAFRWSWWRTRCGSTSSSPPAAWAFSRCFASPAATACSGRWGSRGRRAPRARVYGNAARPWIPAGRAGGCGFPQYAALHPGYGAYGIANAGGV